MLTVPEKQQQLVTGFNGPEMAGRCARCVDSIRRHATDTIWQDSEVLTIRALQALFAVNWDLRRRLQSRSCWREIPDKVAEKETPVSREAFPVNPYY